MNAGGGRRRFSADARFVVGAARVRDLPAASLPEVAFAGRSNVGKSSLLNRILGRRALARVSKTPGRTQQINFFAVGAAVQFVDLPGYGFARVPLRVKEQWRRLVEEYLATRPTLCAVVVIVDARRGLEADDSALLDVLDAYGVPALLVATKMDKLKRSQRAACLTSVSSDRPGATPIPFSATSGEGVNEIWAALDALLPTGAKANKR
jgi:GTP-binding protein